MEREIRYRGKDYGSEEIAFIGRLIAENPTATRRALSLKLCEAWNWVQANGAPRDMVCRGLLLELQRAGLIKLPAPRYCRPIPAPRRRKFALLSGFSFRPLEARLSDVRPLDIRQVRRTEDEALLEALLERHHYLGYTRPVGEHLKYLIRAQGQPVACLVWTSAARHIGCRDRYIGWAKEVRRRNIHLLAYNQRFLILPWVKVPHLATHILGSLARRLSGDWESVYHHPIYFVETFVDPARFRGTCYRAANWVCLGRTTGRGKDDRSKDQRPNRPVKEALGYPLVPDFREKLCAR
jgi:hypothetical protein